MREEFLVTDLMLNHGVVAGIAGVDQRSGEIVALNTKTVVLATGGAMMIYLLQTRRKNSPAMATALLCVAAPS